MKTFLTEKQIVDFVKEGNRIVPAEDYKRLAKIGLNLTGLREENARTYYEHHKAVMVTLPKTDLFRKEWDAERHSWMYRMTNPEIMKAYMQAKGLTAEWHFVSDKRWTQLHDFAIQFGATAKTFIANGGDYHGVISKLGKKYADKDAIRNSQLVKAAVDELFKGLDTKDRVKLTRRLTQYATKPEMSADDFNNLIYG
jgi:hypothetical protein